MGGAWSGWDWDVGLVEEHLTWSGLTEWTNTGFVIEGDVGRKERCWRKGGEEEERKEREGLERDGWKQG